MINDLRDFVLFVVTEVVTDFQRTICQYIVKMIFFKTSTIPLYRLTGS